MPHIVSWFVTTSNTTQRLRESVAARASLEAYQSNVRGFLHELLGGRAAVDPHVPLRESGPTRVKGISSSGDAVAARLTSVWGQRLTTSVLAAYNNKSINNSFGVFSGYSFQGSQQQVYK